MKSANNYRTNYVFTIEKVLHVLAWAKHSPYFDTVFYLLIYYLIIMTFYFNYLLIFLNQFYHTNNVEYRYFIDPHKIRE